MKYNGWEYRTDETGLSIFPTKKERKEFPQFLGRYYGMQNHHLDAFCNRQLYLNQPDDFNDLLDSSYELVDPSDWTIENFKRVYGEVFSKIPLKGQTDEEKIKELRSYWKITNAGSIGVMCTTANGPLHELMWGYYTNNRGFYLDFDTSLLQKELSPPRQINYCSELNCFEKGIDFRLSNIIRLLVKKKIWDTENEWRFLKMQSNQNVPFETTSISGNFHKGQSRLVNWPEGSLKAIYLGYNFLKNFDFTEDGTFTMKKDSSYSLYRFMRELVKSEIPTYQICRRDFKLEPYRVRFDELDDVGRFRQILNETEKPSYRTI